MLTPAVLAKAKETILVDGWTKCQMVSHSGAVCLVGACLIALGIDGEASREEWVEAGRAIDYEFVRYLDRSGTSWNDLEERTEADVLDLLDRLIEEGQDDEEES